MAAGQVTKFPKFPAARVPDSMFKALVPQLGEGGSPRVALSLNRGEVDEEILAAVFGRDEAEALRIVEPFYGACCHVLNILKETIKGECPSGAKIKTAG